MIKVGDRININKLGLREKVAARYDYDINKCRCPVCGGLGITWQSWFSCENPDCLAVALVKTGEVLIPVKEETDA